jgi:polysaccharide deacetylase family protein (PEP-CTERM system associated)
MSTLARAALEPDPTEAPRRGQANGQTEGHAEIEAILSFDVEEHDRIEAASGLKIDPALRACCHKRVAPMTYWLLEQLNQHNLKATFFVVGQFARSEPALIRAIHGAGHEVASHGWDHRWLLSLEPEVFREDLRQSKDTLEQIIGEEVVGFRAPTFSVVRRTAWAIEVLAEMGFLYDSSIFPVHHDRYGVPQAPRCPFMAEGAERAIIEFPPATLRRFGTNLPAGGGGYFRLLPLAVMEHAISQIRRDFQPAVTMLYFHPWEFDPEQPRLPLRRLSRFRTYVGISRARGRLATLLRRHRFARAVDIARDLQRRPSLLPHFAFMPASTPRLVETVATPWPFAPLPNVSQ